MHKKRFLFRNRWLEAEDELNVKQRMQIGIRKCTHARVMSVIPLAFSVSFFCFMLLSSRWPHLTQKVSAEDYQNESLQLTFTGDVMLGRYIQTLAEKEGYEALFQDVENVWSNSDYVFANLEYALLLGDESEYTAEDKTEVLSGTVDSVYALQDVGVNVFCCANNHAGDYGDEAFLESVSWMYSNGMIVSGYYLTPNDLPLYEEDDTLLEMYNKSLEEQYETLICGDGQTVGFLSVVDPASSASHLTDYLMKSSNADLYSYVNSSAMNNDLTVVYIHAGTEYAYEADEDQEELAHALIDAGADIVIGMHSHVLQPVEFYGNGIIFYSLGNFVMDQNQTMSRDSVIVQYNQNETDSYFEIIPVRINSGCPQVTSSQYYINRINRTLTKKLSDEEYYISDMGHVIISWNKSN